MSTPLVSFILATHNRGPTLVRTLERIAACGLPGPAFETLVVDNASSDGTAERVRRQHPEVQLIALAENRGPCAKDLAVARARGAYVVFLDDDSFPLDETIPRMIAHFERCPDLGCAGFVVHLPDGRCECSALPRVFIGCGAGFRREALLAVGGYDQSFFMAAEEYDLSFRLLHAGWRVQTFDDLHVLHLKSSAGRYPSRLAYYDMRNNLVLALAYLPAPWHRAYLQDWTQRYRWLAAGSDAVWPSRRGRWRGLCRGAWRRWTRPRSRLGQAVFRELFGLDAIEARVQRLLDEGARRVLLADLGKNIYAYYWAARRHGLQIAAIADDRYQGPGRSYRGLDIVTRNAGLELDVDAVVISNCSEVHARLTERALRRATVLPVVRWHGWTLGASPPRCDAAKPLNAG